MAPTSKYHSKISVLMYATAVDTAPTIDLSGITRTIEIDESGNKQDTSTRDDYLANATSFVSNPPQRSIKAEGMDTTPNSSRKWQTILVGDTGRVAVYPLGSSPTGLPYEIGNVILDKKNLNMPHDNGGKFQLEWAVNGTWTAGTT